MCLLHTNSTGSTSRSTLLWTLWSWRVSAMFVLFVRWSQILSDRQALQLDLKHATHPAENRDCAHTAEPLRGSGATPDPTPRRVRANIKPQTSHGGQPDRQRQAIVLGERVILIFLNCNPNAMSGQPFPGHLLFYRLFRWRWSICRKKSLN